MRVHAKTPDVEEAMTERMSEAMARVSQLSSDRQDEIAQMLIDIADGEQSGLRLSPEQLAEVEQAMDEDGPYASDEEMEAFFSKYRR